MERKVCKCHNIMIYTNKLIVVCMLSLVFTDDEERFMLDKYFDYKNDVGPTKKFATKNKMWDQICIDLVLKFDRIFTRNQVSHRQRYLESSVKSAAVHKSKTGEGNFNVPYEKDYVLQMGSDDDSLWPELLRDSHTHKKLKPSMPAKANSFLKRKSSHGNYFNLIFM